MEEVVTLQIVTVLRQGRLLETQAHRLRIADGRPEAVTDPVEAGVAVAGVIEAGVCHIVR